MNIFLLIAGALGILGTAITLYYINKTKASDLQRILNYAGVCIIIVLIGFLSELSAGSDEMALTAIKLQDIGISLFIVFLSAFSMAHCRIRIPHVISGFITIFALIDFFAILFSNIGSYYYDDLFYEDLFFRSQILCTGYGVGKYIESALLVFISVLTVYVTNNHHKLRGAGDSKGTVNVAYLNLLPAFGVIVNALFQMFGIRIAVWLVFICWLSLYYNVNKFRMSDPAQTAKDDIIDSIEEGFVVLDATGKIIFINEHAKKIFPELMYEETQDRVMEKIYRQDVDDSERYTIELEEKRYQISKVPFFEQKTYKGTTIWISDKTEEYLSTQRLIELKEEAEKASKAKSLFLANMSHEIRTPMNAIVGMTELILHDNINSNVEENAVNIRSASNTLLSIINGILDFSRIETGNLDLQEKEYNPGMIIKDICNMINLKLVDKNVELIVHVKDTIPSVLYGDETHLRQIFTNILTNAVKYTKRGYIRMNVDWEEKDGFAWLKVSIEDTGCGIKEESIPTLFDSFQRADMIKNRTIEGTGLGLAICKRLVESMGGEISVKSSYGIGSVFSFYLVQKIVDSTPIGDYDSLELYDGGGEEKKMLIAPLAKILVVDDNITNIKVARGILTMYQVRVDTATSGKECLEKLQNNNYHMIFMDQMMPEMDGIETTKLIRLSNDPAIRNMPVIALTANAITGTREMFLQSGFQEYISKPIQLESVESVLKKFLPPEIIRYVDKPEDDMDYSMVEIRLPFVDEKVGLANYGDDPGKYLQILKYINDDGPGQLQRMQDYLDGEHYREYVYEAHALKGLMAGIGAKGLAELARIQEYAGRDGNVSVIKRDSGYMLQQYENMLENIHRLLNDNGLLRDEIIQIREEELTWDEFCNMLHELQGSLDLLEQGEAARKTDNLLTYPFDEGIRKQLIEIKHAINEFEYDEATELIRQLL